MNNPPLSDVPLPLDNLCHLQKVVSDLQASIQSRESIAAELKAQYESQIAALEEENFRLREENAQALLIRQIQDELNGGIDEDCDFSPILEQKVLNLQLNLQRIRENYKKKEERYKCQIEDLEKLALERVQKLLQCEDGMRDTMSKNHIGTSGCETQQSDTDTKRNLVIREARREMGGSSSCSLRKPSI